MIITYDVQTNHAHSIITNANANGVDIIRFTNLQGVNSDTYGNICLNGALKFVKNEQNLAIVYGNDTTDGANIVEIEGFFKNPDTCPIKILSFTYTYNDGMTSHTLEESVNLVDLLKGQGEGAKYSGIYLEHCYGDYIGQDDYYSGRKLSIDGTVYNDKIDGGIGNDTLSTGKCNDLVDGSYGDDTIKSQGGNNTFVFEYGPDQREGTFASVRADGNDTIICEDLTGNDTLKFYALVGFEDKTVELQNSNGNTIDVTFKADMKMEASGNDLIIYYGDLESDGVGKGKVTIQNYFLGSSVKNIVIESNYYGNTIFRADEAGNPIKFKDLPGTIANVQTAYVSDIIPAQEINIAKYLEQGMIELF